MRFEQLLLSLCLISLTVGIGAHQPYQAHIHVGQEEGGVSASNLLDLIRDLRTESVELLIPFYSPSTAIAIDIDLRGIDTFTAFPENSTTLIVSIPQADIFETFTGATRDDSFKLFKDYIRDGGNHRHLLKAYARYSPIDPIAGNPNSLLAQMAQSDYLLGKLSPLSGCDCCRSAQPIIDQFQIGSYIGRGFSKGFDTTIVTLPLRYSYSLNSESALILDAPFTYVRNGGASSLFTSLGLGWRLPLTHAWSVTPTFRMGGGGSLDLCTSGAFVLAGLLSTYNLKYHSFVLTLVNYAGYSSSTNLWLSGVNFNYHLHNYIFKNGLSLTTCEGFALFERAINFNVSITDSYFAKDRLFIRHYDEIALSFIANNINPCLAYDSLSIRLAYQFGQKRYKGYCLNTIYQF